MRDVRVAPSGFGPPRSPRSWAHNAVTGKNIKNIIDFGYKNELRKSCGCTSREWSWLVDIPANTTIKFFAIGDWFQKYTIEREFVVQPAPPGTDRSCVPRAAKSANTKKWIGIGFGIFFGALILGVIIYKLCCAPRRRGGNGGKVLPPPDLDGSTDAPKPGTPPEMTAAVPYGTGPGPTAFTANPYANNPPPPAAVTDGANPYASSYPAGAANPYAGQSDGAVLPPYAPPPGAPPPAAVAGWGTRDVEATAGMGGEKAAFAEKPLAEKQSWGEDSPAPTAPAHAGPSAWAPPPAAADSAWTSAAPTDPTWVPNTNTPANAAPQSKWS